MVVNRIPQIYLDPSTLPSQSENIFKYFDIRVGTENIYKSSCNNYLSPKLN